MAYAELHAISNFSFLRGASHPHELIEQAAHLGYRALALTDECSLAGIVRAHVAAKDHGFKLIVGSEFRLEDELTLVLLAPSRHAYTEISGLITLARRRSPKGEYRLGVRDLEFTTRHCLAIWLAGQSSNALHDLHAQLLLKIFGERLWIGVEMHLGPNEQQRYLQLYQLASRHAIPMVACGGVRMHIRERKPLLDILTAIRFNTPVAELGTRLSANAECSLRPLEELLQRYPKALLDESAHIAERCRFSLEELRYEYPQEVVPPGKSPSEWLRHLVMHGARIRWPQGITPAVSALIEKELTLIKELHYEYYFLTVHDIVEFARSKGILCQGRGSAANSVVCYCLFITEVDPARMSMLFERFISKERNEPPDIDVDFEHQRREEVIQYIYRKYTRERAALAATVIRYRPRSAVRDVGKALGLDALFVDQLARSLSWWDRRADLQKRFEDANLHGATSMAKHFMTLLDQILGFPRHLSQHVGGFIITRSSISGLVPVENASMPDRTVIQWDKDDIEALGLLKVDILALGMLSAIQRCFGLIRDAHDTVIDMSRIPAEDPKTYAMISRGDTIGVFQIESRAQMAMLPRLKPATFYDLVIEVAIVRPGPIQGDMVHPYLKRRQGLEPVTYPNDDIREVLERTLGVPIFQEQVIKLAMVAAGFSGGEADQLRRAMAAWKRDGALMQFEQRVLDGMQARGHSLEFAQRLFNQMKGFGDYGFPESHAASFALLAYASAWLKCHYPAAFCCALLNSLPMGFYSASQLVQDIRRHGVEVKPIDVDHSQWESTLVRTKDINAPALRLGLKLIKGLSADTAGRIINARSQQAFRNVHDLSQRAGLDSGERERLASAGALARIGGHRYQAHWRTQAVEPHRPLLAVADAANANYEAEETQLQAPEESHDVFEDYRSTGLTLRRHPLALLRAQHPFRQCRRAAELATLNSGRFVQVAGLVTGRQRPGTASGVLFLTLEDETGNISVVIWKNRQEPFRKALLSGQLLLVKGIAETRDRVTHVIAGEIIDQTPALARLGELNVRPRSFR